MLKAGHEKARERGLIVTKVVCISMREAQERRRTACRRWHPHCGIRATY